MAEPAATVRSPLTGRRLRVGVARSQREGVRPRAIDRVRLTMRERLEMEENELLLRADGVLDQRPRKLADCPPDGTPCPWTACRYHLAIDVNKRAIRVNFPDRELAGMKETCSLRVANRQHAKHEVLGHEEVGALMNLTAERTRQLERSALRKVRAALEALALEAPPA